MSASGGLHHLAAQVRGVAGRGRRLGRRLVDRLPAGIRGPLRDVTQKGLVTLGQGEVVPAQAFEDFLVDQLHELRRESGGGALAGDYLEFGVYLGTSLGAAVRALDRAAVAGARFVGFDSFEGLPPGSEADGWRSGEFAASRSVAEWNLARQGVGHRVELVEGWFDVTCTPQAAERHQLDRVLVAMIDCDTYTSSRQALDFVEPLLGPHSLVIFDDWYARNPDGRELEGQRRAFSEVLARSPHLSVADAGRSGFHGQAFRLTRVAGAAPATPPHRPPDRQAAVG